MTTSFNVFITPCSGGTFLVHWSCCSRSSCNSYLLYVRVSWPASSWDKQSKCEQCSELSSTDWSYLLLMSMLHIPAHLSDTPPSFSSTDEHDTVQRKTFTKWINAQFSKVMSKLCRQSSSSKCQTFTAPITTHYKMISFPPSTKKGVNYFTWKCILKYRGTDVEALMQVVSANNNKRNN